MFKDEESFVNLTKAYRAHFNNPYLVNVAEEYIDMYCHYVDCLVKTRDLPKTITQAHKNIELVGDIRAFYRKSVGYNPQTNKN